MKAKLQSMLTAKESRKAEIIQKVEQSDSVEEVRSLTTDLEALNGEIRELNDMLAGLPSEEEARTQAVNNPVPEIVKTQLKTDTKKADAGDIEARVEKIAKELRNREEVRITPDVLAYLEKRAATTENILIENKYKRTVEDNFNEVAQTIDLVDAFQLDGGNSYGVAFQVTDGDADYTAEGTTFTNDEGTFGTASTGRAKITNSAIVNREVVDLPNVDYLTRVVGSVRKSMRKKISSQIMVGLGGDNQLRGILNAPAGTIPATYKVEVASIGPNTLREIVFGYGGDEDVESPATLFLNKLDLAAFAAVLATDGRPYYAIAYNGASGTIQEVGGGLRVPYTINSACLALSASTTVTGSKTMVYGNPTNYEMPMFSPLIIRRSDERYIEQGKIGFFGDVILGGVVNKYKGFLPVSKKV